MNTDHGEKWSKLGESGGKEVGGHGNQVLGLLSDVALCTDSKNEYVHLVGLLY